MSFKRKILVLAFFLLLAASLLGCLAAVAYFFIPSYVESRLIPEIAARLGGDDITFKIRRIHFTGTDLGPIIIGDPKRPALEAETVRIDYTPAQLYKKHVERIVISGVTLHARYQDGVFTLRGLDIEEIFENLSAGEASGTDNGEMAPVISIGGLALRNATIEMIWEEKTFRIPTEIRFTPENPRLDQLNFEIACYLRGGAVTATGRVDLSAATITTDFQAKALELARYGEFTDLVSGLELSGRVDVSGKAVIGLKPFKVNAFSAAAQCRGTRIIHNRVTLANPRDSRDSELPIHIKIQGNDASGWALSMSRFALVTPAPVYFDAVDCKINTGPAAIEGTGTFSLDLSRFITGLPSHASAQELSLLKGQFEASWAAPGRWAFMLDSIDQKPQPATAKNILFSAPAVKVTTGIPVLKVSGSGTREKATAEFRLDLPGIKAKAEPAAVLSTAGIAIKGSARVEDISTLPTFSSDFDLTATSLGFKMDTTTAAIPSINIKGKISGDNAGRHRLDALAKFTRGTVSDVGLKLRADGIRGQLPLHWPLEGKGEKGSVSVSGIKYQGRALGSVAAVFQQNGGVIGFSGTHASRVLPDLRLQFSGNAGLSPADKLETAIDFKIPGYKPPVDLDLGTFTPAAKGFKMGGELALAGRVALSGSGVKSELKTVLRNGRLSFEEMGLAIDGIEVAVAIPDLLRMQSAPAQQLRFQTARLGEIKMDTGQVVFQIEPGGALFIEKGSFNWCGGLCGRTGQVSGAFLHLRLALPDLPVPSHGQGHEKKRAGGEFLRNRGPVGARCLPAPQ